MSDQPPSMFSPGGAAASAQPAMASAPGTAGDTAAPSDPRGVVPLIRQAAQKYGIDPDVAIRVAASEGLANPVGDGGQSGGAFQLYTGAPGAVGSVFKQQTGLDPLDPKNEPATIDFALRHAAENGWGAWNGAKKIGITGMTGIQPPAGGAQPPQGMVSLSAGNAPAAPSGGMLAQAASGQPPAASPMPAPAGGAAAAGGINPAYIEWAQRQARINAALGRTTPAYLNEAGSLPLAGPKKSAEADAQNRSDVQYAGPIAGAKKNAELPAVNAAEAFKAEQQRVTEGAQPRAVPQEGLYYPPGSPGARNIQNSAMRNGSQLPAGVQAEAGGGFRVMPSGPTGGQVTKTNEEFLKQKDEALAARQGLYTAGLLRDKLHAIGTSGPLTAHLSDIAAIGEQALGPDNNFVKKLLGVNPADHEAATKLSQDLLGEVLKQTFPQRITNADITAWKDTVPRGTQLADAYDFLLDKVLTPKFSRTIDRYGAVADLPTKDPQLTTYTTELEKWDKAHPYEGYQIKRTPIDAATRTEAQNAIMRGASRDAVRQRLFKNGYDTTGF
jgi:hypothetical protein